MRPECKWRHTCVLKHSGKAGGEKKNNATIPIKKLQASKEWNCEAERQPRGYVLSTICSEEDRMATSTRNNSECDIVAFRKDASVQEKEHDLHWAVFCGDETIIAIRTPLLIRICIVKTTILPCLDDVPLVQLHVPRQSPSAIFALAPTLSRASQGAST